MRPQMVTIEAKRFSWTRNRPSPEGIMNVVRELLKADADVRSDNREVVD